MNPYLLMSWLCRNESGWLATRVAGASFLFLLVVAAITLAWPGIESDRRPATELANKDANSEEASRSRMEELWSKHEQREEQEKMNKYVLFSVLYEVSIQLISHVPLQNSRAQLQGGESADGDGPVRRKDRRKVQG